MRRTESETVYEGAIFRVQRESWLHEGGVEVEREIVRHSGAVAIVAHDGEHVWLVRQPRESTGEEALLEIPAGKLDVEGESPREAAERELAEEIGKAAATWEELVWFYTSPGFTDERCSVFLATDLRDVPDSAEEERIEIVPWPLDRLEQAIAESHDSKTVIGLLELARRRSS